MKNFNSSFRFFFCCGIFPIIFLCLIFGFLYLDAQIQIISVIGECEPDPTIKKDSIFFGHLKISANAMGVCLDTQTAVWSYRIDLMNDRIGASNGYDIATSPLNLLKFYSGDTMNISTNSYADRHSHPYDASGLYPYGNHRIVWKVEDSCGNTETFERLFEIMDCKAPVPYCKTGIISIPIPTSGCVDIWAKDLDHGSFDNYTSQENLKFYFNGDLNAPSMKICCDDIIAAGVCDELRVEVEVWVEDESGNHDYCKTIVIVQDVMDICPIDCFLGKIKGKVRTVSGKPSSANLSLFNQNGIVRQTFGKEFNFSHLPLNRTYKLVPFDDSDHINGVTTQDIFLIRKYLLGQQAFISPYQLLAADVNNTKNITTADISEIRKLILGNQERFSKHNSYRFVPGLYPFLNPKIPFNAPGFAEIEFDDRPESHYIEFVKIKIGDVTMDFLAGGLSDQIQRRESKVLMVSASPVINTSENFISYAITNSQFIQMQALQMGFVFESQLEFISVQSGVLNLNNENIGTGLLDRNILRISWDEIDAIECHPNEVLFTLHFRRKMPSVQIPILRLENFGMIHEAYSSEGDIYSLKINNPIIPIESSSFNVFPNPVYDDFIIQSNREIIDQVNLKLFDLQGKEILAKDFNFVSDEHIVQLKELSYNGILIGRLTYGGKVVQFKLLRQAN